MKKAELQARTLILLTVGLLCSSVVYAQEPPTVSLRRAEDILPADEVSRGSLVVIGEDFRFQIPPWFEHVEHPRSRFAYHGTVDGMVEKAHLTLYATREPFAGDLAALVQREVERITSNGGDVSKFAKRSGPVLLTIEGNINLTPLAHRLWANVGGNLDLHVLAVHDGYAYIFHCETPYRSTTWANVGSDCMIRGSTFHVAPPK
jgi:hypothetical protein